MRCIILIILLIPYLSWSMDDFESAASESTDYQAAYLRARDSVHNRPSSPEPIATSVVTPRTARSNSYVEAVQLAKLRSSVEMTPRGGDGLVELEEGLGAVSSTQAELTEDQVAEYFFIRMEGQTLPGIGLFDRNDNNKCADLRAMIGLIKRVAPEKYQGMVKSITRGRSRKRPNKDLIDVLTSVVTSINSLNASTAHVGKEQHDDALQQLALMEEHLKAEQRSFKLAQQVSENTTRRYRMGIIWTLIGGTATVVATNVLQAVLNGLKNSDVAQMTQQMQNTTMS